MPGTRPKSVDFFEVSILVGQIGFKMAREQAVFCFPEMLHEMIGARVAYCVQIVLPRKKVAIYAIAHAESEQVDTTNRFTKFEGLREHVTK